MRNPLVQAPEAFRKQLIALIPRLRRYARSLALDSAPADDLVQTALERALSHWHQFDQRRDLMVWVLSICHNAFLDIRRRDARMTLLDPTALSDYQDSVSADPGVDIGLRMDLQAALASLPPQQREPLLLVSIEQLTYAECAEVLQIPEGTVMSRVSRGRVALRDWLDGNNHSEVLPHGLRRVV